MSTTYWGEIPKVQVNNDSGIAALEREQITKPKPMDVEGHLLHQPSNRHYPPTNETLPSDSFKMDPVVMHTIRLLQHMKKVRVAMEILQQDIKTEVEHSAINLGSIPEYDGPPIRDRSSHKNCADEECESNFVCGVSKPIPPIDDVTCRKLLRRSTAAICSHLAIDSAPESVLDTLTDVCQEFFFQFTRHLSVATDRRAIHGSDGFPDAIERVLHEIGMGSITDLHTFYEKRVLAYHRRVQQQCQALMAEYSSLVKHPPVSLPSVSKQGSTASPNIAGDTLQLLRIKEEPNGSIQFPLLDDKDDVAEAEQLLNIENLGPFEIVEVPTGMTTEMKSKGSQEKATSNSGSKISIWSSLDDASDNPGSTSTHDIASTPQSTMASTPQDTSISTPREISTDEGVLQESASASSVDIFSPTAVPHSKAKKRKY